MKKVLKPGAIYAADNGRLVCLHCAGMSALYTGRDISGQKVHQLDQDEIDGLAEALKWAAVSCESGCTAVTVSKDLPALTIGGAGQASA